MSDASVAVLVVSWNTVHLLESCLQAYDRQDHDDLEIVVVDNASSDGSGHFLDAAAATRRRHPLRVIHQPHNRGFAGAVNDGLRTVDTPIVMFSNVDVVPEPSLVSIMVATLLEDDRRGTIQPKLVRSVLDPHGRSVIDTTGHVLTSARLVRNRGEGELDRGQYDRAGVVFGASGALVMHRREMLDDVAWRDADGDRQVLTEDLFAFFEDVELDWRARLLGWDAWYEPAAVANHERGGIGARRTASVEALNFANRLLVVATCDDGRALLRAAPSVAATTLLKALDLVITEPSAAWPALRQLTGLPAARRRRRALLRRAVQTPAGVVDRWVEPFRFGAWIAAWWQRVRGRAIGVATVGRRRARPWRTDRESRRPPEPDDR